MFNIEKFKDYSFYFLIGIIFLVGVFIRTNLYINGTAFEDDECRLAITMLDKNLWQMFLPLGDAQSAPPIFMFLSKILANLFGYEERVLLQNIAPCKRLQEEIYRSDASSGRKVYQEH